MHVSSAKRSPVLHNRCQANMAHIRQSRPDSSLGFQAPVQIGALAFRRKCRFWPCLSGTCVELSPLLSGALGFRGDLCRTVERITPPPLSRPLSLSLSLSLSLALSCSLSLHIYMCINKHTYIYIYIYIYTCTYIDISCAQVALRGPQALLTILGGSVPFPC